MSFSHLSVLHLFTVSVLQQPDHRQKKQPSKADSFFMCVYLRSLSRRAQSQEQLTLKYSQVPKRWPANFEECIYTHVSALYISILLFLSLGQVCVCYLHVTLFALASVFSISLQFPFTLCSSLSDHRQKSNRADYLFPHTSSF